MKRQHDSEKRKRTTQNLIYQPVVWDILSTPMERMVVKMRTTSDNYNNNGDDAIYQYYKYIHLSALNSWCPLGNKKLRHSQLLLSLFLIIFRCYPFGSQVSKSMGRY